MAKKKISKNYLIAQASALVWKPATSDESNIKGLRGLTLPLGFEMNTQTVVEMGRRIDPVVASGGAYQPITVPANYVPGDPTQVFLQHAALNAEGITELRFYLQQGCDFAALDLVNDPGGVYQVGTFSAPEAPTKGAIYENEVTFLPGGSSVLFCVHTAPGGGALLSFTAPASAGEDASVAGSGDVDFVDQGFEVGDTVYCDWVNNLRPLCCKIKAVEAQSMTLEGGAGDCDLIPTFAGVAATAIHGATPIEVTGLSVTCQ